MAYEGTSGSIEKTFLRHFVEDLLARSLPIELADLRVGVHLLVEELTNSLLERPVILCMSIPHGGPTDTHILMSASRRSCNTPRAHTPRCSMGCGSPQ
jgi:hypothetical protein